MINNPKLKIFSFFLLFKFFVLLKCSQNDFSDEETLSELDLLIDGDGIYRAATPLEDLLAASPSTVPPSHMLHASTNFYDVEEDQEIIMRSCPICCDSLEIDPNTVLTKCGHLFHETCLNFWFRTRKVCPTCRSELLFMSDFTKCEDLKVFVNANNLESLAKKDTKDLIDLFIYAEINGFNDSTPKILEALLEQGKFDWDNEEIRYRITQLIATLIESGKFNDYETLWDRAEFDPEYFDKDIIKLVRGTSDSIKNMLIRIAIYFDADVNRIDEETGKTALQLTATDDRLNVFKMILDSGRAEIGVIDHNSMTILHSAIDSGNLETAKIILKLESPFYRAQIKEIVNHFDNKGRSPLYLAIIQNNPEIFTLLLVEHDADLDQKCPDGSSVLETIIRSSEYYEFFDIVLKRLEDDMLRFNLAAKIAYEHPEYFFSSAILNLEKELIAANIKITEFLAISNEIQEIPAKEVEAKFDVKVLFQDENNWQKLPQVWEAIVANNEIEETFDIFKKYEERYILFEYPIVAKEFTLYMLKSARKDEFLYNFLKFFSYQSTIIASVALRANIKDDLIDDYLRLSIEAPVCYWDAMISCEGNVDEFNVVKAKWEKNKAKYLLPFAPNEYKVFAHKCNVLVKLYDYIESDDKKIGEDIIKNNDLLTGHIIPVVLALVKNGKIDFAIRLLEHLDETKIENISDGILNSNNFDYMVKLAKDLPERVKNVLFSSEKDLILFNQKFKLFNFEIIPESNFDYVNFKVCYEFIANIEGIDEVISFCPRMIYCCADIIDILNTLNFSSSAALLQYLRIPMIFPYGLIKFHFERHTYGPGIVQLIVDSEEVIDILKQLRICLPISNEAISKLKIDQDLQNVNHLQNILRPESLDLAFSSDWRYLENFEFITGKDVATLLEESNLISDLENDPHKYKKYQHIFIYMMTKDPQLIHKISSKYLKKVIKADFKIYKDAQSQKDMQS